jgi:solute carrier family 25 phosphate transporter 23/24/25/41
MRVSDVVSELEVNMEEPQNQRDRRVEDLWKKLDPAGHGELDFKGLQKGLRRIDHPLKNADQMLKAIIGLVDTSGDGKIQYEEFRVFVEAAERQLLMLFRSIDRDKDGRLNKRELQSAFQRAGLSVPNRRLSGFFNEIDLNRDGFITFDEWR